MGSVVFAFFLIMVAGGFIAYFGDRLGYVMGKKRVTLFGLRPRHTATTLTVIAGVLIGGFTLAFLIGVNQAFRIALLKGEQQIRENIRLKRSNYALRITAEKDRATAISAQQSASAAESAAAYALSQTQSARIGLIAAKSDLAAEQKQLIAKQTQLAHLATDLTAEQSQLAEVRSKVDLEQEDLKAATLRLEQGVEHRRGASLIYRDQGEVGRTVISAAETPLEIRADLVLFLQRLSQSAKSHGAKIGVNGRSVIIASIELLDQQPQDSGVFVDENGSLDALTASIHSYGVGSVVIVASALGNSFEGDQVIIFLRPFANILAIRAGTTIAQTVITGGTSSVNDIAGQLQRFLITEVRPAAIKSGVIPVRNSLTGDEELGDITLQQIYEIVTQIRGISGPATVTASVADDVYSSDQLKLVFTVRADSASGN